MSQPLARHFRSAALQFATGLLLVVDGRAESARVFLADGFDFPVGKPDYTGFYRARGFRANGHPGEDWNGRGGGNSDLGQPVYAIAHGVVVYSANYHQGWGNVVILRHAYQEANGRIRFADSLYAHLGKRTVQLGALIRRGQQVGTIGTNDGMYWAHLHLEIRKNLEIGLDRPKYAQDERNYFYPTSFIEDHRTLRAGPALVSVPGFRTPTPGQAHPAEPASAVEQEMSRFLAQQPKAKPAGSAAPETEPVQPSYLTAKTDRPEAPQERAKIREFWQRLRGVWPQGNYAASTSSASLDR